MKISSHQVRAALEAYVAARSEQQVRSAEAAATDAPQSVRSLERRLKTMPEERETIVHDLRRKIRRGRYFVSSRDIVDALLGRLTADLLHQEP